MKVLGEFVLVQQTDTKKKSLIHIPGANKEGNYETTFEIKQIGASVPENYGIKVGDVPIFNTHVAFNGMNVTSPKGEDKVITALTMVHYLDIIAIES